MSRIYGSWPFLDKWISFALSPFPPLPVVRPLRMMQKISYRGNLLAIDQHTEYLLCLAKQYQVESCQHCCRVTKKACCNQLSPCLWNLSLILISMEQYLRRHSQNLRQLLSIWVLTLLHTAAFDPFLFHSSPQPMHLVMWENISQEFCVLIIMLIGYAIMFNTVFLMSVSSQKTSSPLLEEISLQLNDTIMMSRPLCLEWGPAHREGRARWQIPCLEEKGHSFIDYRFFISCCSIGWGQQVQLTAQLLSAPSSTSLLG